MYIEIALASDRKHTFPLDNNGELSTISWKVSLKKTEHLQRS